MSLEAILAKIMEDAESEARLILEEAEKEREKERTHHSRRLEEKRKRNKDRLESRISDSEKRKEFHVRRDAEKKILNARRTLMDEAVKKAVETLASENDRDYLELISALLRKCDLTGTVQVIISERDSSRITPEFLEAHSSGEKSFILSDKRHDDIGGVILRTGDISQNGTFAMIAQLSHEELIMELSGILGTESS